jgi:hypothetical protein
MLLDRMAFVVGQALRLPATLVWQPTRLPYNFGTLLALPSVRFILSASANTRD